MSGYNIICKYNVFIIYINNEVPNICINCFHLEYCMTNTTAKLFYFYNNK